PVETTEAGGQQDRQARRNQRNRQANQETPVAETPVAETPVAELPVVEAPTPDTSGGEPAADTTSVNVSGTGTSTSDPFTLDAGRYRVRAAVEATTTGTFTVDLTAPDGTTQSLFDDPIDGSPSWAART